jgi:hypothetical protein
MMMGGKKKAKPKAEVEDDDEGFGSGAPPEEGQVSTLLVAPTQAQKCNEFIDAVWVEPGEGEAAIKSLVIEETVLPEMKAAAKQKRKDKGQDLTSDFVHSLVMIGLNLIAPDCGWVLTGDGWRYADGQAFEGKVLDVYEGLNQIALTVIEEANQPEKASLGFAEAGLPDPKPEEGPALGFDEG